MLDLDGAPLHVDETRPDGPAVTEKDPHHVVAADDLDGDTVGRERDRLMPMPVSDVESARCVAVNDAVRRGKSVFVNEEERDTEAPHSVVRCVREVLRPEVELVSVGEIVGEREFHIREAVVITKPTTLLVAEPAPSGGTVVRFMHSANARMSIRV